MKKTCLVILLLIISVGLILPKNTVKQTRKGYNVYLKSGDEYVKSDTNTFPKKGYVLNTSESSCENGGVLSQDPTTKEISVEVSKSDKCNLYFDEHNVNIMEAFNDASINNTTTDVIELDSPSTTCTNTLAYDGTSDNNLRHVGSNPCNYVTFNGETAGWRIVGIMNNVDDGTGNLETRIKLVKKDSLGSYSWDSSESSVNSGRGVNDWTQADLKNELNGDYLNTSLNANTNWYNGQNNSQTGVFDYTKRLNAAAQSLIGDAKWYLGGFTNNNANLIPSTMYVNERGTTVYSGRPTEWTGKVAIIYPSDYGYATAGGQTTARSACIGTLSTYSDESGETWVNSSYSDCDSNDWVPYQWALSPFSDYPYVAFLVGNDGVRGFTSNNDGPVRPAVYLKSGVTISGGNGTESEPYVLE